MPVDSTPAVEGPVARPRFISLRPGEPSIPTERALFVWHHPPPPHARRGAGVVLCPSLGYEYMSAYRTWRILAERLAALGFDTLRLDYDGTGNSAGGPEDPGRVDAWLNSIARAVAEARTLSGSRVVALVGLRAGALLSLQAAAADGGVTRLVLWNPFSSGRAYVRELKALARLSGQDDAPEGADDCAMNAEGHVITRDTVAALSAWTLDAITTRPASEVLLIDRDDRPVDPIVAGHLRLSGSDVVRIQCPGTAEMLLPPHLSRVPGRTLDEIETWFRDWRVPPSPPSTELEIVDEGRGTVARHGDFEERTVRFGPGRRLFGVLACPASGASRAPAIILLNTGAGHHVGPHRLYVPLAREWAASGHIVLRFDLGGLGDSTAPPGAQENDVYPEHMLDDARDAIALVRREAPGRELIMAGLCSGGWLAFEAARQGLAVDAIVSINAPMYLRDADRQWLKEGRALDRYQQSMRDPSKWMKALRGGASYATFTQVAASALARRVSVRVRGVLGDGRSNGLANDLTSIAGRGIRSLFVFSRGDNGLTYFRLHAQPALRRAKVRDLVRHVVVEEAGHTFRPRGAQQILRKLLIDFVAARTGDRADVAGHR